MEVNSDKKVENHQNCPVSKALSVIGGKWALPIIFNLKDGKKRFKELERAVSGISTRMLVKELKNMAAHQIVERSAYATIPPTVEYELTDKGFDLFPVIEALVNWNQIYYDDNSSD